LRVFCCLTPEQRLQALEQSLGIRKHQTAFVLRLTCAPTPGQQAEIDEAKQTRRPVLIIRGTPLEIDPALRVIVEVAEYGGSGSVKPDMTPLERSNRWD
jgi:hypothetical protein